MAARRITHPLLPMLFALLAATGRAQVDRAVGSITRSDSIDLLHTRIELDLRQVLSGTIGAKASITFVAKVATLSTLPLDLLQLTVDSVRLNGLPLTFTHVGEELLIDLGQAYGPGDTLTVDVYYGGDPAVDSSGWGGFYTQSAYQYDLGVAFDAVPHSYGRSWFPCFDNFVERCTFEFLVHTAGDRTVFANGELVSETDLGNDEHLFHWRIDEPIPSYLASVASTNYVAVRDTFPSVGGAQIPVTLVAKPTDTTEMKSSFIHLQNAFDTFEQWFGPYRWDRVGYVLTGQGAMEHPTNVCYPASIADGTLQYEETMAHELAHHWFGDLITCRRAEEMYINEGAAEYLSYLFLEDLYGRPAYEEKVRTVHHDMVAKAHLMDGGWYALSEVPQEDTYGEHSYRKGADIFHTLRGYLGDTLFELGFTHVLAANAFSDMSTEELRDSLGTATGVDLSDFFADWVQQAGWASFEVDSLHVQDLGNNWIASAFVQQKLRHADHLYEQVPVTITLEDVNGLRWTDPQTHLLSGEFSTITNEPPFLPVRAFVNADERLALASTVSVDTLTVPQQVNLALADITLVVGSMPAPSPIRAEEFWVAADESTAEAFAFQVSPDRWWRLTGQLASGAEVDLRIQVDGRPTSGTCYDPGLIQNNGVVSFIEDSLVLLYRPNPHFPWAVHADTEINFQGSDHTDGFARLTGNNIPLGDYTVGWRKSALALADGDDPMQGWRVFPNPSSEFITIEAPRAARQLNVRLLLQDSSGRVLREGPVGSARTRMDIRSIAAQEVFLTAIIPGEGAVALGRISIVR